MVARIARGPESTPAEPAVWDTPTWIYVTWASRTRAIASIWFGPVGAVKRTVTPLSIAVTLETMGRPSLAETSLDVQTYAACPRSGTGLIGMPFDPGTTFGSAAWNCDTERRVEATSNSTPTE